MSALPDTTRQEVGGPARESRERAVRRRSVTALFRTAQPVVAFWVRYWWLMALVVPALVALKVFLIMAGVPWWSVALLAVALIAVKVILINWHARRASRRA